jgi:hypothetical protein
LVETDIISDEKFNAYISRIPYANPS